MSEEERQVEIEAMKARKTLEKKKAYVESNLCLKWTLLLTKLHFFLNILLRHSDRKNTD